MEEIFIAGRCVNEMGNINGSGFSSPAKYQLFIYRKYLFVIE